MEGSSGDFVQTLYQSYLSALGLCDLPVPYEHNSTAVYNIDGPVEAEECCFELPSDTKLNIELPSDTKLNTWSSRDISWDCPASVSRSLDHRRPENPDLEAARKRKKIADREYRQRRKEKLVTAENQVTLLQQQLNSLRKDNESLRMAQFENTLSLQSQQERMKQLEEQLQQLKNDHQKQIIFVEFLLEQLATVRDNNPVQVQTDGTVKHQHCVSRPYESSNPNKLDMKQLFEKENAKHLKKIIEALYEKIHHHHQATPPEKLLLGLRERCLQSLTN